MNTEIPKYILKAYPSGGSAGIRIPFEHEIPKDKQDPKIKKILRNPKITGPEILTWAV